MATPISYQDIYLYSTNNSESAALRVFLDSNLIEYNNLNYVDVDGKTATLGALNTWFDDLQNPGQKVEFSDFPILIYEKLFWQSEDGEEKLLKRAFSTTVENLPSDFIEKSPKVA